MSPRPVRVAFDGVSAGLVKAAREAKLAISGVGSEAKETSREVVAAERQQTAALQRNTAAQRTNTAAARASAAAHSQVTGTLKALGFTVGGLGLATLAVGLKKSADAAIDAERVQKKLEVAVRNAGLSYQEHARHIDDVIQKHARLSGLDDEDLSESFSNLIRTTRNVNEALKLNGLAADIARTKGMDLAGAGSLLARVYNGNLRGLKSLGLEITPVTTATDALRRRIAEAKDGGEKWTKAQLEQIRGLKAQAAETDKLSTRQKAMAELQRAFGGQAEAYGKTTAGAFDRAKVSIENAEEVIGAALLPTLGKLATAVADYLDGLQKSGKLQEYVERTARTVKDALDGIHDGFFAVKAILDPLAKLTGGYVELLKALVLLKMAGKLAEIAAGFHKVAVAEAEANAAAVGGKGVPGGGLTGGLKGLAKNWNVQVLIAIVGMELLKEAQRRIDKLSGPTIADTKRSELGKGITFDPATGTIHPAGSENTDFFSLTKAQAAKTLGISVAELEKRLKALTKAYQDAKAAADDATTSFDSPLTAGVPKNADLVMKIARSQKGVKYSWGGGSTSGPSYGIEQGANIFGFDCSSFVQYVFAKVGIQLPRVSEDQWKVGQDVTGSALRRGDLVFFHMGPRGPGHVGIYLGDDTFIHAPHTGTVIQEAQFSGTLGYCGARRVLKVDTTTPAPTPKDDDDLKVGAKRKRGGQTFTYAGGGNWSVPGGGFADWQTIKEDYPAKKGDTPLPQGTTTTKPGPLADPQVKEDQLLAGRINEFFKAGAKRVGKRSVLTNAGEIFVRAGRKYGLDPAFLAAVAAQESAFGTSLYRKNNCMGWGGLDFPSLEACIFTAAAGIQKGYVMEGRTTVEAWAAKYSPPGADNDPNATNVYEAPRVSGYLRALGGDPNTITGPYGTGTPFTAPKPPKKVAELIPLRLQQARAEAELTKRLDDDLAAVKAEIGYLQGKLKRTKDPAKRLEITKTLVDLKDEADRIRGEIKTEAKAELDALQELVATRVRRSGRRGDDYFRRDTTVAQVRATIAQVEREEAAAMARAGAAIARAVNAEERRQRQVLNQARKAGAQTAAELLAQINVVTGQPTRTMPLAALQARLRELQKVLRTGTAAAVAAARRELAKLATVVPASVQAAQTALEARRSRFEAGFQKLAGRILSAFDRETEKHLNAMRRDVSAAIDAIQREAEGETPAERRLRDFDEARAAKERARRRAELEAQLGKAETPEERAQIERELADMALDEQRAGLEAEAQSERKALEESIQRRVQALQEDLSLREAAYSEARALQRESLEAELADWLENLESKEATWSDFVAWLQGKGATGIFGTELPDPVAAMGDAGASQGSAFADAYIAELKRAYDAYQAFLAGQDPTSVGPSSQTPPAWGPRAIDPLDGSSPRGGTFVDRGQTVLSGSSDRQAAETAAALAAALAPAMSRSSSSGPAGPVFVLGTTEREVSRALAKMTRSEDRKIVGYRAPL